MKVVSLLNVLDLIHAVPEVEKRLADDMSRQIYESRLKYMVTRNLDDRHYDALKLDLEWQIPELDDMYRINTKVDNIVIFGCGADGKYVLGLIKNSKYRNVPVFFCDNDSRKWGKEENEGGDCGLTVISPKELFDSYRESIVIIGSSINKISIYDQLVRHYPRERILYPRISVLIGRNGCQYFDYFAPNENEIFVDVGCLNGNTSLEFTKWATKGYEYIYAFEANSQSLKSCEATFEKFSLKGEVINKGLWNENAVLYFQAENLNPGSSKIVKDGKLKIETSKLDEVLGGKRVTFIKMDIEGAEYNALVGAEKTIKKWHPRLAISIYHKPEDILEIPALLLEMNKNYKFALRQYRAHGTETILYAFD